MTLGREANGLLSTQLLLEEGDRAPTPCRTKAMQSFQEDHFIIAFVTTICSMIGLFFGAFESYYKFLKCVLLTDHSLTDHSVTMIVTNSPQSYGRCSTPWSCDQNLGDCELACIYDSPPPLL